MKINSFIIDDERNSREVLKKLLLKFCPEVSLSGEAADAESAFTSLSRTSAPDLIFLDIQMPRENGFDFLRRFEKIPFSVIFTTSYDEYSLQAIKFSALDYLLKPLDPGELQSAVQKAMIRKMESENSILNLLDNLTPGKTDKKIAFHHSGKVRFIALSDISHFEGDGPYSHAYVKQERLTLSKTLKELEDFIVQPSPFVRINKGLLINASYISEYTKGDPFIITLSGLVQFEVSRRRKADVLKALKE